MTPEETLAPAEVSVHLRMTPTGIAIESTPTLEVLTDAERALSGQRKYVGGLAILLLRLHEAVSRINADFTPASRHPQMH